ncbi:hypothetical protein BGZ73_001725 [Actinomortierella ambigua]|nr:hypothetical protein BGZ73_001725 [Actinomortierella ambigua]
MAQSPVVFTTIELDDKPRHGARARPTAHQVRGKARRKALKASQPINMSPSPQVAQDVVVKPESSEPARSGLDADAPPASPPKETSPSPSDTSQRQPSPPPSSKQDQSPISTPRPTLSFSSLLAAGTNFFKPVGLMLQGGAKKTPVPSHMVTHRTFHSLGFDDHSDTDSLPSLDEVIPVSMSGANTPAIRMREQSTDADQIHSGDDDQLTDSQIQPGQRLPSASPSHTSTPEPDDNHGRTNTYSPTAQSPQDMDNGLASEDEQYDPADSKEAGNDMNASQQMDPTLSVDEDNFDRGQGDGQQYSSPVRHVSSSPRQNSAESIASVEDLQASAQDVFATHEKLDEAVLPADVTKHSPVTEAAAVIETPSDPEPKNTHPVSARSRPRARQLAAARSSTSLPAPSRQSPTKNRMEIVIELLAHDNEKSHNVPLNPAAPTPRKRGPGRQRKVEKATPTTEPSSPMRLRTRRALAAATAVVDTGSEEPQHGESNGSVPLAQPIPRKRGRPSRKDIEQQQLQLQQQQQQQHMAHQQEPVASVRVGPAKRGRSRKHPQPPTQPPSSSITHAKPNEAHEEPYTLGDGAIESESWSEGSQRGEDETPSMSEYMGAERKMEEDEVYGNKRRRMAPRASKMLEQTSLPGRRISARLRGRAKAAMLDHGNESERSFSDGSEESFYEWVSTPPQQPTGARARRKLPESEDDETDDIRTTSPAREQEEVAPKEWMESGSVGSPSPGHDDSRPDSPSKLKGLDVVDVSGRRTQPREMHQAEDAYDYEAPENQDTSVLLEETSLSESWYPQAHTDHSPVATHFSQIDDTHVPSDLRRLHRLYRQHGYWNTETNRPQRPREWSRLFVFGTALHLPDDQ